MSQFTFTGGTVHQDGTVSMGSDERLWVQFYTRSVQNNWKSQEAGRPVFEDKDFVKIIQPGERDCVDREASEFDQMRFPKQWAAYQSKAEQAPEGSPISLLFPSEPSLVDTMRALKIFTIEQLAGISEAGIAKLGMGGRAHVERAKRFMEAAAKFGHAHEMQRQLDAAHDKIAELQSAIEMLKAEAPKRRGRPPRNDHDTDLEQEP